MLRELIIQNRSYRRFNQAHTIDRSTLVDLVDLARMSASAANLQSLKYMLSWEPARNAQIFETVGWAAYLKDWAGPKEGERPSAYIVVLGDTRISKNHFCDEGISGQSILLGATERGLGGCMMASIKHNKLRAALEIPEYFEIVLVIALGKPVEKVVLELLSEDGDIKYWRDDDDVHHVPKRGLDEVVVDPGE